jgi:hypothetical protein
MTKRNYTLSVLLKVNRIDVFVRRIYLEIIIENLKYGQVNKGLELRVNNDYELFKSPIRFLFLMGLLNTYTY